MERARAPDYRAVCKRLGDDGWLGVGWPNEYGGQGRGPIEQLIFFEEAERARVPMPVIALNTVGPTLMRYGSEEQKDFFLPKILAGEIDFAVGYSEPEAGTDLASLRTRAVREGDEYVINGNKIFTSGAEDCEYVWLAARTNPDVPKHRGITIFILETRHPGLQGHTDHDARRTADDGNVLRGRPRPGSAIVGEENQGWTLITNQLNHERVALTTTGWVVRSGSRSSTGRGRRRAREPWVQLNLARVDALIEALKLFNWRVAAIARARTPRTGRRVRAEGARDGVVHRVLPAHARSRWDEAASSSADAGRRAERRARAGLSFRRDPHVRRRRERGPAHDHRDRRTGDADDQEARVRSRR